MDKQVTLNKIEQLISKIQQAQGEKPDPALERILGAAIELAIQIRQQIRKA